MNARSLWSVLIGLLLIGCTSTFFDGLARPLPRSPWGNRLALSCHNCYKTDLASTLATIHRAQTDGADLIELDISEPAPNGTIQVFHGDPSTLQGPSFASVLADSALRAGDQPLFIEIKEETPSRAFATRVLDELATWGYMKPGRPVYLRSFFPKNLTYLQAVLAAAPYDAYAEHIRLSLLFRRNAFASDAGWRDGIQAQRDAGFAMVEFDAGSPSLMSKISFARSLKLGVNVYTFKRYGEVWAATFKHDVDVITVEPDQLRAARGALRYDNDIIYLNTVHHKADVSQIVYLEESKGTTRDLSEPSFPAFQWFGADTASYGGALAFDRRQARYVRFSDVDNDPDGGFLVMAVVGFDQLTLGPNEAQAIVSKSDAGGFALELQHDVLRFGVHVAGSYRYATCPISKLNTTDSFLVVGAYDGNGGVRLWLNQAEVGSVSTSGGVTQNDSPIVIGADPQGPSAQRFHFSGRVQVVSIQKWTER